MVPVLPAVFLFAWLFGLWLLHTTVLAIPILLVVAMTFLIVCLVTYLLVGRHRCVRRLTAGDRLARFLPIQAARLLLPVRHRE